MNFLILWGLSILLGYKWFPEFRVGHTERRGTRCPRYSAEGVEAEAIEKIVLHDSVIDLESLFDYKEAFKKMGDAFAHKCQQKQFVTTSKECLVLFNSSPIVVQPQICRCFTPSHDSERVVVLP